jgi:hypothetical protein
VRGRAAAANMHGKRAAQASMSRSWGGGWPLVHASRHPSAAQRCTAMHARVASGAPASPVCAWLKGWIAQCWVGSVVEAAAAMKQGGALIVIRLPAASMQLCAAAFAQSLLRRVVRRACGSGSSGKCAGTRRRLRRHPGSHQACVGVSSAAFARHCVAHSRMEPTQQRRQHTHCGCPVIMGKVAAAKQTACGAQHWAQQPQQACHV